MRSRLSILLLVFALGNAQVARAEPVPPVPLTPVPSGPDVIVPLVKGQSAPSDGQLFDQATALRWANYLQQCTARLRLDVLYQYKMDQADLVFAQTELDAERQQAERVTADLRKQLAHAQDEINRTPFYNTVWFGIALGALATVGVVAGTATLLNAVR